MRKRLHAPTLFAAIVSSLIIAAPFAVFAWIVLDGLSS